jgi:hypothetical protein
MGLWNVRKLEEIHDRDRFDYTFQKVTAKGSAVAQADHDVAVHMGLAILARDLAHEAQDFNLVRFEWDRIEVLLLSVVETEDGLREAADRSEAGDVNVLVPRDLRHSFQEFLTGIKDDDMRVLTMCAIFQVLDFHVVSVILASLPSQSARVFVTATSCVSARRLRTLD